MNPSALREHATTIPRQDGFVGTWQAIFWQPNLFIPQRFIVGVLVQDSYGHCAHKVMDKPGRIECFFRPAPIRQEFRGLMALLNAALLSRDPDLPTPLPSANFSLGERLFVRGVSADAVVKQVYNAIVPADDIRSKDDTTYGPDTETVRKEVSVLLKDLLGMAYEDVVREEGEVFSAHYLDVTLAPPKGVGGVVSACYKSPVAIEMHILRAARDVTAYASAQHRPQKALFLLEPDDDAPIPPKDRKAIDDLIGNQCWALEQSGFATPRNRTLKEMATDIYEWSTPLLA